MYLLMIISTLGVGFCIAIIGPLISGFIKKNFLKYWFVNRYLFFKYGIGCSYSSGSVLSLTNLVNTWTIAISIWGIIPIFNCFSLVVLLQEIQLKMRKI